MSNSWGEYKETISTSSFFSRNHGAQGTTNNSDHDTARAGSSSHLPAGYHKHLKNPGSLGRSLFPSKLRQLLADSEREGNQNVVSWMPHGRAFKVHKPKEFASKIVGRYFNHGQYRSFTRQLYHYGFGKVDCGNDRGAFYHLSFLRDDPDQDLWIDRKRPVTAEACHEANEGPEDSSRQDAHTEKKISGSIHPHDYLLKKKDDNPLEPNARGNIMLETSINVLSTNTNGETRDIHDLILGKKTEAGLADLLKLNSQKLPSTEEQKEKATQKNLKTQAPSNEKDVADFGDDSWGCSADGSNLLFGDIEDDIFASSTIETQGTKSPPQAEQQMNDTDWFSAIEKSSFNGHSFAREYSAIYGSDLEPLPLEQMQQGCRFSSRSRGNKS